MYSQNIVLSVTVVTAAAALELEIKQVVELTRLPILASNRQSDRCTDRQISDKQTNISNQSVL